MINAYLCFNTQEPYQCWFFFFLVLDIQDATTKVNDILSSHEVEFKVAWALLYHCED